VGGKDFSDMKQGFSKMEGKKTLTHSILPESENRANSDRNDLDGKGEKFFGAAGIERKITD